MKNQYFIVQKMPLRRSLLFYLRKLNSCLLYMFLDFVSLQSVIATILSY